jgi:hypothetical protein
MDSDFSKRFYENKYGHEVADLEITFAQTNRTNNIFLAGDILDNKLYLPIKDSYKEDIANNINRLISKYPSTSHSARCFNCAVRETKIKYKFDSKTGSIELNDQDKFIESKIKSDDTIIVSLGLYDIVNPFDETRDNIERMKSNIDNIDAIAYFENLFCNKLKVYIESLYNNDIDKQPKYIFICMSYYPYNSDLNFKKIINKIYEIGIKKIIINNKDGKNIAIPCSLFNEMDSSNSIYYITSSGIELSEYGSKYIAEYLFFTYMINEIPVIDKIFLEKFALDNGKPIDVVYIGMSKDFIKSLSGASENLNKKDKINKTFYNYTLETCKFLLTNIK